MDFPSIFCYNSVLKGTRRILGGGSEMKRFLLITAFVLCCSTAWGRELHVRPEDYNSIQSAIDDANDGDVVIVAAGTYQENIDFLGEAITVRSVNPNDPNVVAATVIDGSNPADPNYGSVVIFRNGEDANSVLSGFTITGGTGSWVAVSWEYKGLRWNRCGGGVVCYNMSAPTISKNVFTGNIAGQGGGIYIYGDPVDPNDPSDPSVHISPVITDNTFINNSAIIGHGFTPPDSNYPANDNGDGGGIVGFQGCDAVITGNLITDNHGDFYGGGIHLRQWSNGLIEDNQIIGNDSRLGAGIHITYRSAPEIVDNLIEYNEAGTFGGGGINVYGSSEPRIRNNIIRRNTSSRGAGIAVLSGSKPVISTNLIVDNFDGAGILCVGTAPDIIHNTIANNTARWYSGGIHCEYGASPLIKHNIISSNGDGYGIQVYGSTPSEPTIRFNDIWNHPLGNYHPDIGDQTGVNGNISANPVFVDAQGGDYHLAVSSPCINAGDPNYSLLPGEMDFEGDSRILGQYVDIGADEGWPVWNITSVTQYAGIQQAIDDANDGDTIIVSRGRYYETINFGTHQIILSSANPNDWDVVEQTIIDANQTGTAVIISGGQGPNTIFRGFTITGGDATNGHAGGVWCYASPIITRNIITGNYASYKGGGIYLWGSSAAPLIKDNRIINNTANYGGGIFCDTSSQPLLEDNFIGYNTAIYTAGGICYASNTGTVDLLGNTIFCNQAGRCGGGMYVERACVNAMNNIFAGNMATSFGGAIVIGYYNPNECSDPNVVNNSIACNKAPQGGGVYCASKTTPRIANNIISFGSQGEGIYGFYDPCQPGWEAEPNVSHNDVFGNPDGNYGGSLGDQMGINGNISIDPNFVDVGYWDDANTPSDANDDFFVPGNYHILPISACIDVGDNNSLPVSLGTDIDGEERIFEGTVDIGADEVVTNPIDLNNDGIVDYLELEVLAGEWLQEGAELQSDFYDDNFIDFADMSVLAGEWLWRGGWYE